MLRPTTTLTLCSFLVCAPGSAIETGLVTGPSTNSVVPLTVTLTPVRTVPIVTTPVLTQAGATLLEQTVKHHMTLRKAQLLSRDDFRLSGTLPANDALETAFQLDARWYVSPNLSQATPATAPTIGLDPAAAEGARGIARTRLGREPTPAEVTAEIAAFDRNVQRINDALFAKRDQIAAAYRNTGQFPRELEAPIIGLKVPSATITQLGADEQLRINNALANAFNSAAATAVILSPTP